MLRILTKQFPNVLFLFKKLRHLESGVNKLLKCAFNLQGSDYVYTCTVLQRQFKL